MQVFQNLVPVLLIALLCVSSVKAQATKNGDLNLAELDAIVGNAKYVNFGEDSHFMTEVHESVAQMFPHLAEKKKFRVFVFESAWGIEDKFRDFMNSDRTEVNADEMFFLNAFNSKPIVKMLVWIREWNRKNPNDKIQIAGYQPEQPVTDFRALWKFTEKSDKFAAADLKKQAEICRAGTGEFKTDIEFISAGSKRRRSGQLTFTTEERAGCNGAIDRIEQFIEQNKKELIKKNSKNAYLEAQMHVKSLRTYMNVLTPTLDFSLVNKNPSYEDQKNLTSKVYEQGDKIRFEIFEVLRQTRYKNKKIFFWMHNWHAMKFAPEVEGFGRTEGEPTLPAGTNSIGTRMAEKYGKDLIVIGNIVPRAVCKNPICTAPPARADLLETKFADYFGTRSAFIDLRNPSEAEKKLPLNATGSIYADLNQGHFAKVILGRQFDAILYLPETTAVFEQK
jgi:erythromycin esterase-like protein